MMGMTDARAWDMTDARAWDMTDARAWDMTDARAWDMTSIYFLTSPLFPYSPPVCSYVLYSLTSVLSPGITFKG
jgi:hypothetical protein